MSSIAVQGTASTSWTTPQRLQVLKNIFYNLNQKASIDCSAYKATQSSLAPHEQPPGRRAPPPWQLAMPALDSSLPATISTIAASHPQRHAVPLQHNSPSHAMVLDNLPYSNPNREKRANAIHAGRAWHQQPLLPSYRIRMSMKRTNP